MKATGRHLLVEYQNCNPDHLNDVASIERLMNEAARAAGSTIVASVFHPFTPQGVSGVVVIEESHLSIHTWPEHRYAAVDFFTCGDCVPERAKEVLKEGLEAQSTEVMFVHRGNLDEPKSMTLLDHRTETSDETTVHAAKLPKMSTSIAEGELKNQTRILN